MLNGIIVDAPVTIESIMLISCAAKLPVPSRNTSVLATAVFVAAATSTVAAATLAAVWPPTKLTTVAPCVPVTSPDNDPLKFVAIVAVVALPLKLAVIVPALKFPDASRATIAFAVFPLVAEVAEFKTLPDVAIVANFVSAIAAVGDTSALTINELDKLPEASL